MFEGPTLNMNIVGSRISARLVLKVFVCLLEFYLLWGESSDVNLEWVIAL